MPTNIKDYSTTQASNTSLNGISVAEGMLPSNLNNAIRALMKNTREWFNDSQWVEYGDGDGAYTATYASATSFTIAGVDVSSIYHEGRRIKLTATTPGTIYGTISSSSFSTNTTVNVTWDSGSLSNEAISNVYIGALSKTNNSIPTGIIATAKLADGSVTTVKIAADAVDGTKIADDSINSEHYVDGSIDTAHIADSQITDAKLASDSVTTDKIANVNVTSAKIADSAITSAKIADGAIVNADVNSSAAIDATKIHDGTVSNTEFGYLNGTTSAIQTQLDGKLTTSNNLSEVTATTARSNLGLGSISTQASTNVSITGGAISGLSDPTTNSEAATKNYVDQAVAGLRTRIVAEVATTANVDLTADLQNGDTIDGVTLVTGDRVLVKDQTDATANGVYLAVASGTASRDPEYNTIPELSGQMVVVNQGTANDNKIFLCTTDSDATIGVSNITFTQVTPSNTGTVTSIGIADSGAGEFTVSNSPITSAGNISLALNTVGNSKLGTGIDATKIADGSVTSTEFQYINTLSSNAQTQIDAKLSNIVEDTTPQLGGQLDVNGQSIGDGTNELIKFSETGSAVNELTVTNAATGNAPEISATGNDSNIDLKLTPKGSGKLNLDGIKFPNADGSADQILKTDGSGNLSFTDVSGGTSWQAVKTSGFTAVAGEGYFCNTTSAAFTVTLPAGSIGSTIELVDYAGTFATNNLTISPDGTEKIEGNTGNRIMGTDREGIKLVYVDGTTGWTVVTASREESNPWYIAPYSIEFLVVAGGGTSGPNNGGGGGGGAGGYRTSTQSSIAAGNTITVTVGAGGSAPSNANGADSSVSSSAITDITSAGGGYGGNGFGPNGNAGGSGGGAGDPGGAGAGNTPSTTPSQGNSGGSASGGSGWNGGGGGGSSAVGGNASGQSGGTGGAGGAGTPNSITGSAVTYAGGGGGTAHNGAGGAGGAGGGGQGYGQSPSTSGADGTANTGGGAGAGRNSGGSGVVILKVPTASYSGTTTGSPTVTTSGSDTIIKFTGSGTYVT